MKYAMIFVETLTFEIVISSKLKSHLKNVNLINILAWKIHTLLAGYCSIHFILKGFRLRFLELFLHEWIDLG
jgi:hypothetical protein